MKKLKGKNTLKLNIYLSRVDKKLFVALDSNKPDLDEFGIDTDLFGKLGERVDKAFQDILGNKNGK